MKNIRIEFQSDKEIFVHGKTTKEAQYNTTDLINYFFSNSWKVINSPQVCADGYKVKIELK